MDTFDRKRLVVELDQQLADQLEGLASSAGVSSAELAQEVLSDYLSDVAVAHKSWDHYKTTGLHLTHEEVGSWIENLNAGGEPEPPKCHK